MFLCDYCNETVNQYEGGITINIYDSTTQQEIYYHTHRQCWDSIINTISKDSLLEWVDSQIEKAQHINTPTE